MFPSEYNIRETTLTDLISFAQQNLPTKEWVYVFRFIVLVANMIMYSCSLEQM